MSEYICKYCDGSRKNPNSLRNHERLCKKNPDRQHTSFEDSEVQKALSIKKKECGYLNGATKAKALGVPFITSIETRAKLSKANKNRSPEFRAQIGKKISATVKEKVANGEWHYSFSKVRTHEHISPYAGPVKLHGSWEVAYAQYLDANHIKWRRPTQKVDKFYYEYDELKTGSGYYIPDFYLLDEDIWVEIKGYETAKDQAKWKWFPHHLKVLKSKDLKELDINIIT
jgi:hypothetical protein